MRKNLLFSVLIFLLSLSSFLASAAGIAVTVATDQPIISGIENITVTGGAQVVVVRTEQVHPKKRTTAARHFRNKTRPSVKKILTRVHNGSGHSSNVDPVLKYRGEKSPAQLFFGRADGACASVPTDFRIKMLLAFATAFLLAFVFHRETGSLYHFFSGSFKFKTRLYRCRPPPYAQI